MDLLPTEEQLEIVAAAAAFLEREVPRSLIRDRRGTPSVVDAGTWSAVAALGWFGLGLPEAAGGVGYTLAEEALLFREIGRSLAPGPFLAGVLAARVASAAGAGEVAAAVVSGEAVVGLAEPRGAGAVIGHRVSGRLTVLDGAGVDYLLVLAEEGAALVAAGEIALEELPCIDPGVRLARASVDDRPAVAYAPAAQEPAFLRGCVLAAAALAGMAEAVRDMAVGYAKARVQFGRPIGVHQAIKHPCADMAARAEVATSQVLFAALSLEGGRSDAEFQARSAKIVAADAAIANGAANIQIHGGMGYTFEHDAHLYLKRAHVVESMIGPTRRHLARLLALPGPQ